MNIGSVHNAPAPSQGRKGDLSDLEEGLNAAQRLVGTDTEETLAIRRDILQKVISATTHGIDTSPLFAKVVMLVNSQDIIQKKMIYQYIVHYAKKKSEMAIMGLNTLCSDCRDTHSPLIRGLALRHLASMRGVAKLSTYLTPLVKQGLNDPSPYVRKTAVLSIIKLKHINPQVIESEKLVNHLYTLIRDKDPQVVVNCIQALEELLLDEGGMKAPKKMVYFLLNRVKEYNQWQLGVVLDLVKKYVPKEKDEIFTIMNLLDDLLNLANAHVVMSITNVFLKLSENLPKTHLRVYKRLKEPLLLMMASSSSEMAYSISKHIKLMVKRCPQVFHPSFQDFFPRYYDPTYLKEVKFDILTLLANRDNVSVIMDELSHHVSKNNTEDDQYNARVAIRALGKVAVAVPEATEISLTHLLDFLEMSLVHVISETFIVLVDILRKYRNDDFCAVYLPQLTKHWKLIESDESKAAFIWILGEFGTTDMLKQAPYILETFIDEYEELAQAVRLEVLTSAMKLFFKRPPEMHAMLGRLLHQAIEDVSNADVHDKALFYYRLLQANVQIAKEVISTPKELVTEFAEEESAEFSDMLFSEFNTLSIIYDQLAEKFIVKTPGVLGSNEDEVLDDDEDVSSDEEEEDPHYDEEPVEQPTSNVQEGNLLGEFTSSPPQQQQAPQQSGLSELVLDPPEVELEEFEAVFKTSEGGRMSFPIQVPSDLDDFEEELENYGIMCLASQTDSAPYRFFFYAQLKRDTSSLFLIEMRLTNDGTVKATIKHPHGAKAVEVFKPVFFEAFSNYR